MNQTHSVFGKYSNVILWLIEQCEYWFFYEVLGIPDANEYESFAFADLWLFVHSAVYNLRETP